MPCFSLCLLLNLFVHFADRPHNPMLNSGALVLCALQKVML